jgi:hypothetical protein
LSAAIDGAESVRNDGRALPSTIRRVWWMLGMSVEQHANLELQ